MSAIRCTCGDPECQIRMHVEPRDSGGVCLLFTNQYGDDTIAYLSHEDASQLRTQLDELLNPDLAATGQGV